MMTRRVEVFEGDKDDRIFIAEFDFLPRVGDYLSRDVGGYFKYYDVVEVWHREETENRQFRACVRVRVDD